VRGPILIINAGSSSVKFSVFEALPDASLRASVHGQIEKIGLSAQLTIIDAGGKTLKDEGVSAVDQEAAVQAIHAWLVEYMGSGATLSGVGHRVVHGGMTYTKPVLVDENILEDLDRLVPLAPLHQPHNLAAIRAMRTIAPNAPQVACFDTSFHRTQPRVAQEFALPRAMTAKGILRYGFHGLSYEYIASVLPRVAPENARGRVVAAHLGNGASMCAMEGGRSVATTMGFTAIDGLPMGTRTGAIDPGVILYLIEQEGMSIQAVEHMIYYSSGLLGMSGVSSDMRTLLASHDPAAKEAVDLFVYRIGRELGSLAAALGGLDALIFTAGIGENAAEIRARVCRDANWLGIRLDEAANARGGPCISALGSTASAWVVPTDENLMIARHTQALLNEAI
jgi:acetate kinase